MAARVGGFWLAEVASQSAAVDLKAPAASGPARAAPVRIAERKVTILTGGAVAAGIGAALDDQRSADADLDGQVQGAASVPRRTRPGLGHTSQGGVVAEHDRDPMRRGDPLQVYRLPPEAGRLDQTLLHHGAGDRHPDRNHTTRMAHDKLTDRRAQGLDDGLGIASQVPAAPDDGALAIEPSQRAPPVLMAQVDGHHHRTPGIGGEDAGGPTTATARCATLDEPSHRAQPRRDLGRRRAGQTQSAGEFHPSQTR